MKLYADTSVRRTLQIVGESLAKVPLVGDDGL